MYASLEISRWYCFRQTEDVYRNQPGRIENYIPGHSSISEKEAKEVNFYCTLNVFPKTCFNKGFMLVVPAQNV